MAMFLVAMMVMLLVVVGMSVGVIFGRKPLTGSCGGVGKALGEKDYTCEICGGDEQKCEESQQEQGTQAPRGNADLAVDATRRPRS